MQKGRFNNTAKSLCYTAVAVALLSVSSWISVPIGGLPITLQSLALFLIAGLLGVKRTFFAVLAYLLLGFFGVPVFAGFTGGITKLFTPAGGYLLGFLAVAPLVGGLCKRKDGLTKKLLIMCIGTFICYAIATIWWTVISALQNAGVGLVGALVVCVLPYVPFDLIKVFFAAYLTEKLKDKIY